MKRTQPASQLPGLETGGRRGAPASVAMAAAWRAGHPPRGECCATTAQARHQPSVRIAGMRAGRAARGGGGCAQGRGLAPVLAGDGLGLGPAGPKLPVDQRAFMDIVTVGTVAEAPEVFSKWGVVRVPSLLSAEEVEVLLRAARDHGVRRDAFAQDSQSDRYTLWIAGDGMSKAQQAASETLRQAAPCLERAVHRGDRSSFRPVCDAFGYPNLMLAEVVTSAPGGAPQDWHFDGEGITAQISLVTIGESNGPTEIQPRPVPRGYMRWMKHLASQPAGKRRDDTAEVLAELTSEIKSMYDRLTRAHEFAWNTLRPILGGNVQVARSIIEAGLTPAVVHMVADIGCLTLYDAAMIHRGGQNRGTTERPILAVHINKENKQERQRTRIREKSEGLTTVMKQKGFTEQPSKQPAAIAFAPKAPSAVPGFNVPQIAGSQDPDVAHRLASKGKKVKRKGSVKGTRKKASVKKKGGFGG